MDPRRRAYRFGGDTVIHENQRSYDPLPPRRHEDLSNPVIGENEHGSISNFKIKIHNILFDNADKIPDGVYKELMEALINK